MAILDVFNRRLQQRRVHRQTAVLFGLVDPTTVHALEESSQLKEQRDQLRCFAR
jgi:hypothetical protein